jgi:ferric-dicitrate binding protein FerR (iron transport regulator)
MMSEHPSNDELRSDELPDEDLVAYLDGELDVEASRRIESQLAADACLQERLQKLQRTWDLLGELDQSPVDDEFTRSTLEMVAVKATEGEAVRPWGRRMVVVASVAAACAAGFVAVALGWPNPNRRLLEDLPVLENLDSYRQVGDIQFLRLLSNEHLFDQDAAGKDEWKP